VQGAQNFVAKFCWVSRSAQRISKANEAVHLFFQGNMTSDTATHTLADQDCRAIRARSRVGQRLPMGRHELRQAVGPLPIFSHVGIVENRDATNRC
jgi:hypothetical protein